MVSSIVARRTLFSFLCLISVSAAQAEEWETTLTQLAGSFPELRAVRVRYGFGWGGFTAANAELHFEKVGGQLQLIGSGKTVGLARTLWAYDLQHRALSDAKTLRPVEVTEVEIARAKQTKTELTFTPQGVTSVREERKGEAVNAKKTRRLEFPNILSLGSALLFVRSQPLNNGDTIRVVVYPATSAYLSTLKVVGRERITVPAGTFDAIKLDGQLNKVGDHHELLPYSKFRKATIWLSNDANRLLLRIEAQIFVGKVYTELQSVQFEKPRQEQAPRPP